MTYGTTHNCRLTTVKPKQDTVSSSPVVRRSGRGEPEYITYDLLTLTPYVLNTWTDFETGRRQEISQTNIDIVGVWEVTQFIQNVVSSVIGRELRVGDQVQFSHRPEWFLLGRAAEDSGMFNTVTSFKFNLLRSNKP